MVGASHPYGYSVSKTVTTRAKDLRQKTVVVAVTLVEVREDILFLCSERRWNINKKE